MNLVLPQPIALSTQASVSFREALSDLEKSVDLFFNKMFCLES